MTHQQSAEKVLVVKPVDGAKDHPRFRADDQAELRARWIAMCKRGDHLHADLRPFVDLKCGARSKRTGLPCPQKGLYANGRCRWHGGLSTGPKTVEGKAKARANLARRVDPGGKPHEDPLKVQPQCNPDEAYPASKVVRCAAAAADCAPSKVGANRRVFAVHKGGTHSDGKGRA